MLHYHHWSNQNLSFFSRFTKAWLSKFPASVVSWLLFSKLEFSKSAVFITGCEELAITDSTCSTVCSTVGCCETFLASLDCSPEIGTWLCHHVRQLFDRWLWRVLQINSRQNISSLALRSHKNPGCGSLIRMTALLANFQDFSNPFLSYHYDHETDFSPPLFIMRSLLRYFPFASDDRMTRNVTVLALINF